jgi:hypothetical protein
MQCLRSCDVHNNKEVEVVVCESLKMQKPDFCSDMMLKLVPR